VTVSRGRLILAAVLVIAAALVSTLVLFQHHGEPGALTGSEAVCGPGSGCDTVAQSPYARFAGLPLAAWGLLFYGSVAVLLALAAAEGEAGAAAAGLAFYGLAAALILDAGLLALQAFVIRAYCALCLATYVLGGLALAALLPARRAAPRALLRSGARTIFVGWVLGTAALGGLAVAAESALKARERVRATTILGGPSSAPPTPSAASTRSPEAAAPAAPDAETPAAGQDAAADLERYREAARAAEEQARRLQEILDDPKKLDQYFADKARVEFERAPVQEIELQGVPHMGPAEAPIKVVEYSDFLCPYCRSLAQALTGFLPQAGNRLAIFFKNYPLDKECNPNLSTTIHPGACWLALGAVCAQEQGRFWEYHDKVFSVDLHEAKGPDVVRLAAGAALDEAGMESCLVSDRAKQRLSAQIAEAARVGVQATPTLFINGKRLPRISDFLATLDKEAARLGLPPFPKAED